MSVGELEQMGESLLEGPSIGFVLFISAVQRVRTREMLMHVKAMVIAIALWTVARL